jgi:hypothetical protein
VFTEVRPFKAAQLIGLLVSRYLRSAMLQPTDGSKLRIAIEECIFMADGEANRSRPSCWVILDAGDSK